MKNRIIPSNMRNGMVSRGGATGEGERTRLAQHTGPSFLLGSEKMEGPSQFLLRALILFFVLLEMESRA